MVGITSTWSDSIDDDSSANTADFLLPCPTWESISGNTPSKLESAHACQRPINAKVFERLKPNFLTGA